MCKKRSFTGSHSAEEMGTRVIPKGTVVHACDCSAADYWRLREHDGNGFDRFRAAADRNCHEVLSMQEEDGYIKRVSRVTACDNPIPCAMRKMLNVGDKFSFKITEHWWRDKYDAAHPLTMVTEPAVMAERIVVTGREWVEPTSATTCNLWFQLTVKVKIVGVGGAIAKGISDGTLGGYAAIPKHALAYLHRVREIEASGAAAPPEVSCSEEPPPCAKSDSLSSIKLDFSTLDAAQRLARHRSTSRLLAEGLVIAAADRAVRIQRAVRSHHSRENSVNLSFSKGSPSFTKGNSSFTKDNSSFTKDSFSFTKDTPPAPKKMPYDGRDISFNRVHDGLKKTLSSPYHACTSVLSAAENELPSSFASSFESKQGAYLAASRYTDRSPEAAAAAAAAEEGSGGGHEEEAACATGGEEHERRNSSPPESVGSVPAPPVASRDPSNDWRRESAMALRRLISSASESSDRPSRPSSPMPPPAIVSRLRGIYG
mmetsp:Transcript_13385/g.30278  ORF Transcript_13385/g.30278 Transcript_13385/m.30278 type:complete len:485 (-) Transcript_13385:455-1909(-)